jgi:hypothetical protein
MFVASVGMEPRFGSGLDALVLFPFLPWHFLYFFPLPQGHGSFLPTFWAMFNDEERELACKQKASVYTANLILPPC